MHVLLIEDNKAVADMIRLVLEGRGFNLTTAEYGEDGIDLGQTRQQFAHLRLRNRCRRLTIDFPDNFRLRKLLQRFHLSFIHHLIRSGALYTADNENVTLSAKE